MNPISDLSQASFNDLKTLLKHELVSDSVKQKIYKILAKREEKNWEFVQAFFNQDKNLFWRLAKYQLYREGKAITYGVGVHRRFYIEDPMMVFDKMVEIRHVHDKFLQKHNGKKMNFWEAVENYEKENDNATLN